MRYPLYFLKVLESIMPTAGFPHSIFVNEDGNLAVRIIVTKVENIEPDVEGFEPTVVIISIDDESLTHMHKIGRSFIDQYVPHLVRMAQREALDRHAENSEKSSELETTEA